MYPYMSNPCSIFFLNITEFIPGIISISCSQAILIMAGKILPPSWIHFYFMWSFPIGKNSICCSKDCRLSA